MFLALYRGFTKANIEYNPITKSLTPYHVKINILLFKYLQLSLFCLRIYKTSIKQMKKLLLEKNRKHQHQAYYNSGRQLFPSVPRDEQWTGWGQDYDY